MSRPASILDYLRKHLAALSIGSLIGGALVGSAVAADHSIRTNLPVAAAAADGPLSHAEVYDRTVRSTVMLFCPQADGMNISTGSGVILDKARGLVLTNHHVVGTAVQASGCLVEFKDGEVIAEVSHYQQNAKPIKGRVIDSDPTRDLALVQFENLPEDATQVPVARQGARIGDTVLSVGCPQKAQAMWVLTIGTVRVNARRTVRYQDGQTIDCKIALTDSMTNPGDSGGPVVNQRGELVALVSGKATEADALTFFIDLTEVNTFIAATDTLTSATTAEELAARAEHFATKGKKEQAVADLTAAIKLEPENMKLVGRRGEILMSMNKLDDAISDLTEVIDAGDAPASVLSARGWCQLWKNDVESAREDFTAAIAADRKLTTAYHGRGLTHMKASKFSLALADFSRAAKLDPKSSIFVNERGHVYFAQGNFEKALADYTEAVALAPNDAMLHSNRAVALQKLDRQAEAAEAHGEAAKLQPNNADHVNSRGCANFAAGNFEAAVQDFTAAIGINGQNATYWNNRGNSYGRLGQMDKAKADYEVGLKLDPKSAEFQEFASKIAAKNNRRPAPAPAPAPAPMPNDEGGEEAVDEGNTEEGSTEENEGNMEGEEGSDEGEVNPPAEEEEVAGTALPKELLGSWQVRLQTPAGPRFLRMVFAPAGGYVALITDAQGNILEKDAGVARMENGNLVTKSITGGIEKSSIEIRGNRLFATVRESGEPRAIGATLEFTRVG